MCRTSASSCPYLTWASSAQLDAHLELQEPTRHARPTSERLPVAREDSIAAAIVQGNSESACKGRTTRVRSEEGRGRGRVSKATRAAPGRVGVYAASEQEGRKGDVAERVQRSQRWEGSNTAKEEGAGETKAEGQSTGRERARTEHGQGSGLGQAKSRRGRWRGSGVGRERGTTDGMRTRRGRRRRRQSRR